MSLKRRAVAALVVLALGLTPVWRAEATALLHAYYLFLVPAPKDCEDCYVPLIITQSTLEEIKASRQDTAIVVVTTYERDSIWSVEREVALAAGDVSTSDRIVRLRGRRYRYQEITPAEVLRLLEKPQGTIPIHRLKAAPDRKSLEDLIAGFGR